MRAADVQQYLGVSERTARTLISRWRDREGILPRFRPGHMRSLTPEEGFTPSTEVQDPVIMFALLLTAEHFPANPFAQVAPSDGGHDLSLSAKIHTQALKILVKACLERRTASLIYLSKNGKQEFIFSPSALVRSRGRYHFRGYRSNAYDNFVNRLEDRYVDIVPARTLEAWIDPNAPFVGLEKDQEWHQFDEKRFVLSPDLTEEETLCYEHEYGISGKDMLKVKQRCALMPYVCQELSERLCWRRDGTSIKIWSEPLSGDK